MITRKQIIWGGSITALAVGGIVIGSTLGGGNTTSAKPTTPSSPVNSVLTGLPGDAGRVLAVKIDNAAPSRPATGLDKAAVVYAIQVEGGLSRLMAIFDSNNLPPVVGPVRSARETDLRLLPQYGHPALAYSGAQSRLLPVLKADPDIATVDSGYYRSTNRSAPHNEYLTTYGATDKAKAAADIGFRFGPAPAGGTVAGTVVATFQAARFGFEYSGGRYSVYMDRTPSPWKTDNVLSLDVKVTESRFKSRTGFVPFSETVGSGSATFYRNGRAHYGQWSRATENSPTIYTHKGERYQMKAGNTWIILR